MSDTAAMLKAKLANEKLNRANAEMRYTSITSNDDPRIRLTREYNAAMAALTEAETDALLNEWRY